MEPGICEPRKCRNMEGSYRCMCASGYMWNGDSCIGVYYMYLLVRSQFLQVKLRECGHETLRQIQCLSHCISTD